MCFAMAAHFRVVSAAEPRAEEGRRGPTAAATGRRLPRARFPRRAAPSGCPGRITERVRDEGRRRGSSPWPGPRSPAGGDRWSERRLANDLEVGAIAHETVRPPRKPTRGDPAEEPGCLAPTAARAVVCHREDGRAGGERPLAPARSSAWRRRVATGAARCAHRCPRSSAHPLVAIWNLSEAASPIYSLTGHESGRRFHYADAMSHEHSPNIGNDAWNMFDSWEDAPA
jgi:hypothetical protein